ncbi:MAG TPA: hypothetical protein DCE23_09520 [Firmicutes bacterium]|nr:hypothetical protein [Bacillota bacterium]
MKAIRIFIRSVSKAFKSIFRNINLSIASIMCTTVTLIIVSLAMIFSATVNNFTDNLENTLTIITFVDKDATEEEITTIKSRLLEIKNIKSDELLYKSKETIKEETLSSVDKNNALYIIMNKWEKDDNILKSEFVVSVKDITKLKETAEAISKIDKVTDVHYNETVLEKMIPIFDAIKKVTLVIIIGLIIVSIVLICNTIKLTIFARKSEIEIIRLVGTSNLVIKLPFVIEGLFLGIIGSIIPIIVTIWGYIFAFDKLEGYLFANFLKMLDPVPFTLYISVAILVIGSIVGMIGSYLTVRKYLKI